MKTFGDYHWLQSFASSGDPRLIAESVANFVEAFGLMSISISVFLYLVPLIVIALVANLASLARTKKVLLCWPDWFLLVLPVAWWLLLAILFPIGKGALNILELAILGTIAALTFVFRWRTAKPVRTQLAMAGVVATTSIAICFWAFIPAWYR